MPSDLQYKESIKILKELKVLKGGCPPNAYIDLRRVPRNYNDQNMKKIIEILGEFRDIKAQNILIELLNDPQATYRFKSINALEKICNHKSIKPLLNCLNDKPVNI